MSNYAQTIGLAVMTVIEKKRIGTVAGLVFDPDRKQVRWLSLNSGGSYQGRHWIPIEAVKGVGDQVVVISSENDIVGRLFLPASQYRGAEPERIVQAGRRLMRNRVVTEQGVELGRVVNYEFDPNTFQVTRLIVSPPGATSGEIRSIPCSKIVRVEASQIVAAVQAEPRLAPTTEGAPHQSFVARLSRLGHNLLQRGQATNS